MYVTLINVNYFIILKWGYMKMKKITLVGSVVLAGTIALSGVTSIASANEMHQTNTSTYQ